MIHRSGFGRQPTLHWMTCPSCSADHGPLPYVVQIIDQSPWHDNERYPGHPYRSLQVALCPTTNQPITMDQCLGEMLMGSLQTSRQRIGAKIERGELIECTAEEYRLGVRSDLQGIAGRFIDQGQDVKAQIALNEVKRLDALHEFNLLV